MFVDDPRTRFQLDFSLHRLRKSLNKSLQQIAKSVNHYGNTNDQAMNAQKLQIEEILEVIREMGRIQSNCLSTQESMVEILGELRDLAREGVGYGYETSQASYSLPAMANDVGSINKFVATWESGSPGEEGVRTYPIHQKSEDTQGNSWFGGLWD